VAYIGVVVRKHEIVTAETRAIVWSSIARNCRAASVGGCRSSTHHKLTRAIGRYIVYMVRHSSAFRVPAAASPKLYGTDLTQDGVAVFFITSRTR
jgi:hypothetical protein